MTVNESEVAERHDPTTSRLVLVPAVVGAVVAGILTAVWRSAGDGCAATAGLDCVGAALLILVVGTPLAILVCWVVLAWGVGAWRAPTITLAGAAVTVYGYQLSRAYLTDSPWAAAAIGGLAFAGVAVACLPGLGRTMRWAVVLVLAAICVAGFAVN
jgi:hypothetical protein